MENLIYHYTSAEALKNIITTQTFWITKSDYLNDTTEQSVIKRIMNHFFKERTTMSKVVQNYIRDRLDEYLNHYNHYILSFSQIDDSLPLWNYYSENEGYNIGIDKDEFMNQLTKYFTDIDDRAKIRITPIEYVKDSDDPKIVRELLLPIILFNDDDISNKRNSLDEIALKLANMSYAIKHDAYLSEKEERIVVICENTSKIAEGEGFRVLRGSFIPYIIFNKNNTFRIPIKRIKLSPYHSLDVTKKSVQYLVSRKYENLEPEDVSVSEIPSRY